MTTTPFSTAVIVCAQVCVQRVLLSVITEVEEAQLSAVEVMSGLPRFHCVVHSNLCGCVPCTVVLLWYHHCKCSLPPDWFNSPVFRQPEWTSSSSEASDWSKGRRHPSDRG